MGRLAGATGPPAGRTYFAGSWRRGAAGWRGPRASAERGAWRRGNGYGRLRRRRLSKHKTAMHSCVLCLMCASAASGTWTIEKYLDARHKPRRAARARNDAMCIIRLRLAASAGPSQGGSCCTSRLGHGQSRGANSASSTSAARRIAPPGPTRSPQLVSPTRGAAPCSGGGWLSSGSAAHASSHHGSWRRAGGKRRRETTRPLWRAGGSVEIGRGSTCRHTSVSSRGGGHSTRNVLPSVPTWRRRQSTRERSPCCGGGGCRESGPCDGGGGGSGASPRSRTKPRASARLGFEPPVGCRAAAAPSARSAAPAATARARAASTG